MKDIIKHPAGENVERAGLSDEAREARRRYHNEWNKKNRDKVKAAQVRYWNRKADNANKKEGPTGKG